MEATPFERALEALWRPLAFAAGDDFAHLDRLRDLEGSVVQASRGALALAIPDETRKVIEGVAALLSGTLEGEARREAIAQALGELEPLRDPSYAESRLARSIRTLPGVGPRRAAALARRGLSTVLDLLFHLPARYDDRRSRTSIAALEVGRRSTFVAEVLLAGFSSRRGPRGGRRFFQAVVGDGTATLTLKWFHGGEAVASTLHKGRRILVTGEVRRWRFDKEILHPEIDLLDEAGEPPAGAVGIVPDYAVPEGIPPRTFRRLVTHVLERYADLVPSTLPPSLVHQRNLPSTPDALRAIHQPRADADLQVLGERRSPAHQRLVLEELYLLEVGLALRRQQRVAEPGIPIRPGGPAGIRASLLAATLEGLPFALTRAQTAVWREIQADLARPHPMSRLLQGDVGSGKTVVAALAAAAVAECGHQTALMAPTELLAEQHERTLRALLATAKGLRIALLTGSLSRPEAEATRRALARGDVDLVVGTHALVQGEVAFRSLALVVVDEQHRFGVLQRAALASRTPSGRMPHTLVMTATPIPRSLALTLYGDLDLSVLDELPPGRSPVRTLLLRPGQGEQILALIQETLDRGEQVYVVYPLVETSEKLDLRAATESAERIRRALPGRVVDLIHGRMDSTERGRVMDRFLRGECPVLVSTTVIEVGVDVPNATLMIVENAERFGLAQLHQLRGRVGRGSAPGTCVLVARGGTQESEARLRAMLETTDGFRIADADLRIRGPGEFLGTRQHGRLPDLRFADLVRDARLVALARQAALDEVRRDPTLRRAPALVRAVHARWGERLALAAVG